MFATLTAPYLSTLDQTMRQIAADLLQQDEPGFGVMVRYALGWADANDQPYTNITGKRLRPLLLFLCTETAGGNWHTALPAAAAVEFLHNFSLIHDDVQDNSPTRHNRPTVWKIWGVNNAINAGDTLYTIAYLALERLSQALPAQQVVHLLRVFGQTNIALTRGQHLDMRFETQDSVATDDYIRMIGGKTAALLSACAYMGAYIGCGDETRAGYFAEFGRNVGIAFQIRDDILGIWGDPQVTGKSAATDIVSRKKSLPVLYGLAQNPTLAALYQQPHLSDADVQQAISLLDSVKRPRLYRKSGRALFFSGHARA
ncbi:polyprenyl synthetase family protein [bacterium]|nr:polyprenyl synthetase family protein [bacterium]